ILLVDDHSLFLELMRDFLTKAGFLVETAESSAVAIRKLSRRSDEYALVILDYLLGTKAGSEVAKQLLEIRPEQIIIIYSNDKSREALQESWKAGAVEFIDKSVQGEPFLEIVQKWVDRYLASKPADIDSSKEAHARSIAEI